MADTIITVQGEYELKHPAERGAVRLSVAYEGEERSETLALTTQRHASLAAELRELHNPQSGPVISWASDQLRVWGDRPWNQDGRRLAPVFHAEVGMDATFSELTALSDWVGVVSLLDGVTIQGVVWSLTEARRQSITQEARRRAVENAVAKATVYATSLGLTT
ncbi:SIMPL domain-containing protein, partial [Streptomyces bacillaris]|uniref:SIMPL domain-containing protein n=1 Tax=Streptomyces bacillaris TaxID=68179 RepID=UPI0036DBC68A